MEFCLLGPLLVRRGGVTLPVASGKQRAVLAALLLSADRAVSLDELTEVLWGAAPPPSARVSVQNHVMRLRKALGAGARIRTQSHGYEIAVDDSELDVSRFEAHLAAARAAARDGSWDTAAEQARTGLALWRGEPLADVQSDLLATRDIPRLAELRLQAVEVRLDADLHLGRHAEVITEAQRLAAAHPLREPLHGLLMRALYWDGRQAEALAAYQSARQVLVEELGTEPGARLQELHRWILAEDPALAVPESGASSGGRAAVVPRELPAAAAGFVGRAGELAALTGLLDRSAGQARPAIVISAIGGTAGVGKTSLAVQWAHQVAGRFPDGQLYVNLRGYDPDRPLPSADALAGFLRSLGVPGQDIPPEEDERAARYRSLLAGRRVLVVLDNAGSVEQVRPLLPGSPSCAVVVTSRDSLAGLVARHGATRLDLNLLPDAEAISLLRMLIGPRVEDDPGAAETLAGQCCRLPLALRVAAELAATRPDVPLAGLVAELADQQRRLDLLDAGGDPRTAVRAVFSWSYRNLDADAARAFRLLGLHPGPDFDPYAVAALTGICLERANRVLDTLTRAHLIQPAGPGRHGMHDLLHAYALELADRDGADDEQHSALARLLDHYLHTSAAAMDILRPAERHRRPRIPTPATPIPPVTGPAAARAWLDAERATLVAVTVHAAGHGWQSHAARLSATLFRYFDHGVHYPEAMTIHSHARAAAQRAGDRAAEATALYYLAKVHMRQSRYQQAVSYLRQAMTLYRQVGDHSGEGRALVDLGIIHYCQGRYRKAIGIHRHALDMCRQTGDLISKATALYVLAAIEERQGRYDVATRNQRQGLAIAAEIGAGGLQFDALVGLGTVGLRQGRYRQAAGHLDRALALSRDFGYRHGEPEALARIGDVYLRQGRYQRAASCLREAMALYRQVRNRSGEADALNSLGEVWLATGQAHRARAEHSTALGLASRIGDKYQQARAHQGLGQAYRAGGDPGGTRRHWQEALTLFTELGTPEADQIRAQLAAVH
jgi:DNA-binding SARP family transcriptional activator/tetratricopeptide (TPR) repeat protein